jgi:hypothetical protein
VTTDKVEFFRRLCCPVGCGAKVERWESLKAASSACDDQKKCMVAWAREVHDVDACVVMDSEMSATQHARAHVCNDTDNEMCTAADAKGDIQCELSSRRPP